MICFGSSIRNLLVEIFIELIYTKVSRFVSFFNNLISSFDVLLVAQSRVLTTISLPFVFLLSVL